MMLALLHETSSPHLHSGDSAVSLVQVAFVALTLAAGWLLLRAARRARVSRTALHHN